MKEIGEANEWGDTWGPQRGKGINKVDMVSASSSRLDRLITIKTQTSHFMDMEVGSQIYMEKKEIYNNLQKI